MMDRGAANVLSCSRVKGGLHSCWVEAMSCALLSFVSVPFEVRKMLVVDTMRETITLQGSELPPILLRSQC
jgi:hypothetical protein